MRGCFEIIIGKVESDKVSSAQLKGEAVTLGIGGSEMGIGLGIDSEAVCIGGSVCVDIDEEVGWGVKGKFIWVDSKAEEVVVVVGTASVWVATSAWGA